MCRQSHAGIVSLYPLNDRSTLFSKASLWQPPATEVLSWEVCGCRNLSSQTSLSTVSRSGNCFWVCGLVMSISGRKAGQTHNYRYGDKCGLRALELTMSINTFNLWEGNICYKWGNTQHFSCELFKMILMWFNQRPSLKIMEVNKLCGSDHD